MKKIKLNEIESKFHNQLIQYDDEKMKPAQYGKLIASNIIEATNGILKQVSSSLDNGDCLFKNIKNNKIEYCEIKTSYLNDESKKYNVRNIRGYQNFDYFILCFIDKDNNFIPHIYLLPKNVICDTSIFKHSAQNGTARANHYNKNVASSITIQKKNLSYTLDRFNILKDTKLQTLLDYFNEISNIENTPPKTNIENNPKTKSKTTKISFVVTSQTNDILNVSGNSNKNTIVNLVMKIGAKNIYPFVKGYFNPSPTKYQNIYVGDNLYFRPTISLRDTRKFVNSINKKTKFHVQIITKQS